MKIRLLSAAILSAAALSLSACAIPEEDFDTPSSSEVEDAKEDLKKAEKDANDLADAADPGKAGMKDVTVESCIKDGATGWPHANLTIKNNSSKTSDYSVQVEFVDADGDRLDESMAASNNVAPGQKVETKAQGLSEVSGSGIKCKITSVTRTASL